MNTSSFLTMALATLLTGLIGCGGSSSVSTLTAESSVSDNNDNDNGNTATDPTVPKELIEKTGLWTGSAKQTVGGFSIELTISETEQVVDYPSFLCGGYLTLVSSDEETLLFRETITYGRDSCVDQGLVELFDGEENQLGYNYYYDDKKSISLGAWGTLQLNQ